MDQKKSITYTIVRGDTGKFTIDESSGVITTREKLDYEKHSEYTLIVSTREVSENKPEYTATVTVSVLVRYLQFLDTFIFYRGVVFLPPLMRNKFNKNCNMDFQYIMILIGDHEANK